MTGTAQTNWQVVSTFDLFKIGIGPSRSHSTGPMVAASRFLARLADGRRLDLVARVVVSLFASLALTGRGHGTDTAVLLGLTGARPETLDSDGVAARVRAVADGRCLALGGGPEIAFDPAGFCFEAMCFSTATPMGFASRLSTPPAGNLTPPPISQSSAALCWPRMRRGTARSPICLSTTCPITSAARPTFWPWAGGTIKGSLIWYGQ